MISRSPAPVNTPLLVRVVSALALALDVGVAAALHGQRAAEDRVTFDVHQPAGLHVDQPGDRAAAESDRATHAQAGAAVERQRVAGCSGLSRYR